MALNTGINARRISDCTGEIDSKTIFENPNGDKVYYDILYRNYDCSLVPQEQLIVSTKDNLGRWVERYRSNSCYCYGYVMWKNHWMQNPLNTDMELLVEYGGNKVYYTLKGLQESPPPAPPMKYKCSGAPNYLCVPDPNGIYGSLAECQKYCVCTPKWGCEQPLNGYENDLCGHRRPNSICNPPPPPPPPTPPMKYICTDAPFYACLPVVTGGKYDSLVECKAVCKKQPAPPPPPPPIPKPEIDNTMYLIVVVIIIIYMFVRR